MNPETLLTGMLIAGFFMKIAGFVVRDELRLRLLVAGGLFCDALFYSLRADPIWLSVSANVLLVFVNVVLMTVILIERTTWRMRPEDRALFKHFETLTPGQFRRLRKLMDISEAPAGTRLTTEGAPVQDLMLVYADRIDIAKDGVGFPIAGPAFVGEVAFLTGRASSADVTLPAGGRVVRMESARIQARMERSPPLRNAMIALFGGELARKLADSVPMERAALVPVNAAPGAPSERVDSAGSSS